MADRFHINPRTGEPGKCSARLSCPFGSLESDHFDSAAEARKAYEAGNLDNSFATLSKAVDETIDDNLAQSDDKAILEAMANDPNWKAFDPSKGIAQLYNDDAFVNIKTSQVQEGDSVLLPGAGENEADVLISVDTVRGDGTGFAGVAEGGQRYGSPLLGSKNSLRDASYQVIPATSDEMTQLTDETMDEMAAYYETYPTIDSESATDEDGNAVYEVYANGAVAFKTPYADEVETARRVSAAGMWKEVQASQIENKYLRLTDYLNERPEDLAASRQSLMNAIDSEPEAKSARARVRLNVQEEHIEAIELALKIKEVEDKAEANIQFFESGGNPPF